MSENIIVNSTIDQIEEFKQSVLWADIKRELQAWQIGFNREMMSIVDDAASTNPSSASVLLHLGDLNGRQKVVEYILGIPDIFLDIKKAQKQDKQN